VVVRGGNKDPQGDTREISLNKSKDCLRTERQGQRLQGTQNLPKTFPEQRGKKLLMLKLHGLWYFIISA
jgi:hypothetical protein